MTSANDLSIRLLGPLEIRVGETPVGLPGARSSVLLATLALSPRRPVAVAALAERMWREGLPERIGPSVHSNVLRLRRTLGREVILTTGSGYVLDVDPDQVDVQRFRRLMAEARAEHDPALARPLIDAALGLWRGDPLSGLDSEAFAHDEIPALVEEWMDAQQRLAALDAASERWTDAVRALRALIAQEPLREPLWHQLISVLARSGSRATALEAYHELRIRLSDQLGIDPGPDLQQLYHRLIASVSPTPEPAPAPPAPAAPPFPRQLPGSSDRFTGRKAELGELDRLLDEHETEGRRGLVVALVGAAGAGKTALAVRWAHRVADRFPDGQLYANLHGFDPDSPASPGSVLAGFLWALGVPSERIPADDDARAALFRTTTADARLLIIADNVRDADQVRPLLPGPGCVVVVTSRDQLRGLVAREGARRLTVGELPPNDALRLVVDVVGAARAGQEPAAVADLVELCSRLPLALMVAAELTARQPNVPLAQVVEQLRDEGSRLDALTTDDDAATDLRTVFSWSYRRLDPDTAQTFRLLGALPGADHFSVPWAAALVASNPRTVRAWLDRLHAVHLLEQGPPDRYRLHDLLRAYAAERAAAEEPPEAREAAARRAQSWLLHSAAAAVSIQWFGTLIYRPFDLPEPEEHVSPLRFLDAGRALDWLEAQCAELITAASAAVAHGREALAAGLIEVTRRHLLHRNYVHDLMSLVEVGLPVARRLGDCAFEADLMGDLGSASALLRDFGSAIGHHRQALELSIASGHDLGHAMSLIGLANAHQLLRELDQAFAYAQSAYEVARAAGLPMAEARALNSMALIHVRRGDGDTAAAHCREALEILEELGAPVYVARTLDSLGQAHVARGAREEAVDCYRCALRAIAGQGDRRGEAVIHLNLSRSLRAGGAAAEALAHWELALALFAELNDPLADDVRAELGRSPNGRVHVS